MSAAESVHASLASMGFVQLALLFAAAFGYLLTLSQVFPARVRGGAALTALAAAAAFAAATPGWVDGVVVLALAVLAIAGCAAAAWLLANALGLETARRSDAARNEASAPRAAPAPRTTASALVRDH